MTHEQKINFIREKCIEANPRRGWHSQHDLDMAYQEFLDTCDSVLKSKGTITDASAQMVLNRVKKISYSINPIRLADVLLAIKQEFSILSNFNQEIEAHKKLLLPSYLNGVWQSDNLWNLKNDNLESQSPETVDFLFTLLGGNAQ